MSYELWVMGYGLKELKTQDSKLKTQNYSRCDVDGDRRTESRQRGVFVVADLEGELVLSGRQLHLDLILAIAEVHPGRRLGNNGARRQTIGVNGHMVMADAGAGGLHVPLGHRLNLELLDPKTKPHGALHGRAVLGLDEEDPSCGGRRRRR